MSRPSAASGERLNLAQIAMALGVLFTLGAWMTLFMDSVVMPLAVGHEVVAQVPDLKGLSWQRADSVCKARELRLYRGRDRIDRTAAPGTVIDQFPAPLTDTKPGRRIEVVLAMRKSHAVCPSVIDRSPREAQLIADSAGLALPEANIKFRYSTSAPEGVILEQEPAANADVPLGTAMKIFVSLGAQPDVLAAPDLIGRRLQDVPFYIARAGMKLGTVTHYPDRFTPEGTILWQSPAAGEKVNAGEYINLRLAAAPVDTVSERGNEEANND